MDPLDTLLHDAFGFIIIGTRLYVVHTDDRGDRWLEEKRDATPEEQAMYRWLRYTAGHDRYGTRT